MCPRGRTAHDGCVAEGDAPERVVGSEETAVLVCFEDPDGEGGGDGVDAPFSQFQYVQWWTEPAE